MEQQPCIGWTPELSDIVNLTPSLATELSTIVDLPSRLLLPVKVLFIVLSAILDLPSLVLFTTKKLFNLQRSLTHVTSPHCSCSICRICRATSPHTSSSL